MVKTIFETSMPIDEKFSIKKHVIRHGNGKKRICIVTGTHGDELEGQYICFQLQHDIKKELEFLDGIVEVYPALNPMGIDSITRGIPNFDLDMNRIFPGDPDGTMAEQAAAAVVEDLKGADLVIDIHSSNIFLREVPQVRISEYTADKLVPLARHLNLSFIWVHAAATVLESTLAHSLNSVGTPTLVVELGVGMRINHYYGRKLTLGIKNLMREMGMWKGDIDMTEFSEPILSVGDQVSFVNAPASGIFSTETRNNKIVEKGDSLGQIISPLTGDVIKDIKSPCRGYLFTIRAYPVCYEGSLLARIHRLK
ncbi:MAG: succinylglutamate desuccinylase/aspartoacylase family protein [Bacteroidales bacterium]|nr:succinylglutamate desuccinylase/aspartoacylase family protein [Candidatus Cryptobacteroides caccocaballi]